MNAETYWNSLLAIAPEADVLPHDSLHSKLHALVWIDAELGSNGLFSTIINVGHYMTLAAIGMRHINALAQAAVIEKIIDTLPSGCFASFMKTRVNAYEKWEKHNENLSERFSDMYGQADMKNGGIFELFQTFYSLPKEGLS